MCIHRCRHVCYVPTLLQHELADLGEGRPKWAPEVNGPPHHRKSGECYGKNNDASF